MQHTLESNEATHRLANGTIDYDWYIARAAALRHAALHGRQGAASHVATGRGSALRTAGAPGCPHTV